MRSITRTAVLMLLGCALAVPSALTAQESRAPWRLSYFPYLTASPNEGVMGIARAIWFKQAGWGERITLRQYLAVEAGYSTHDAWKASATFGAPRLADGWRLKAHAQVGDDPRFGDFDQLSLDHELAQGWIDVTRRLQGPFSLAVRGSARHDKLVYNPDGPLSFERSQTDLSLRGALVWDTRDREFEVNQGALVEFGGIAGTGGGGKNDGYAAPYLSARGWVHPYLPLRLTGRVAWRGTTGSGAIAPSYEFPGWEGNFTVLGGFHSQRGLPIGAVPIDGVMLAGAEARLDVINVGEIGAVTLIGFVDGGKLLFGKTDVYPQDSRISPRLIRQGSGSSDDWIWAGGGGIAIRVLRAATLTVSAARAEHDTRWYVGSGWSW